MIEFETKAIYYDKQTDPLETDYPITTLQVNEQKEEDSLDQSQPLNTNEDEYEEEVLELMIKIEDGWMCNKCPYRSRRHKSHVREHVQRNIKGFSFKCKFCDNSFSKKSSIRYHMYSSHEDVVHKQRQIRTY